MPWKVETDASEVATSAILHQQQDGVWRMVDCLSTKLQDAQLNYNIYNLELLTVVWAFEEWQHNLLGQDFKVHMDHKNLLYSFPLMLVLSS